MPIGNAWLWWQWIDCAKCIWSFALSLSLSLPLSPLLHWCIKSMPLVVMVRVWSAERPFCVLSMTKIYPTTTPPTEICFKAMTPTAKRLHFDVDMIKSRWWLRRYSWHKQWRAHETVQNLPTVTGFCVSCGVLVPSSKLQRTVKARIAWM